ncbi:hypothetical protein [Anaerotignum faecicola]
MDDSTNLGYYYCIDCKHIGRLTNMYFDKCEKCISDNCIIFHNKITIPLYEIDMLKQVSRDKKFLQAMVDLQENDIIEYQMRINQIEQQINIQKHQSQSNQPRCPKCGSTAISTGARGVNYLWGFIGASKTVNRCSNCGHTWKPRG